MVKGDTFAYKQKIMQFDCFSKFYNNLKMKEKACVKLRKCYDDVSLTERACPRRFAKFRSDDFNINDVPDSRRPMKADDDGIKALVESNPRCTTGETAKIDR